MLDVRVRWHGQVASEGSIVVEDWGGDEQQERADSVAVSEDLESSYAERLCEPQEERVDVALEGEQEQIDWEDSR